ncbi:MAG: hypothetical protein AAGI91_12025 [Bacteroidota bacterium]
MNGPGTRPLFLRSTAVTALLPLIALPFWAADLNVGAWSGSLGLYEVLVAPLLLVLAAFSFYRRVRWLRVRRYMAALGGASLLGVGLWYLGLGWHGGTLLRPDRLTLELMGIALGAQCLAAYGAVMVIAGMRRLKAAE